MGHRQHPSASLPSGLWANPSYLLHMFEYPFVHATFKMCTEENTLRLAVFPSLGWPNPSRFTRIQASEAPEVCVHRLSTIDDLERVLIGEGRGYPPGPPNRRRFGPRTSPSPPAACPPRGARSLL